jgi:4-amino-4-deoxy-L-arabinose transferase-like glycosyltransferase
MKWQTLLKYNKIDFVFVAFIIVILAYYNYHISQMAIPFWDGAIYLENARDWLKGQPLIESYRPPLISWIIAGIWSIFGEDWILAKYIQMGFTVGAGVLLYLTLRSKKGGLFALGVSVLTMLNPQIFFWSTQILTEGLSLFFLVLALYCLKSEKQYHWFFAGVAMALTFASRYPIFLPAIVLFIVESIARKNIRLISYTIVTLVPVMILIVSAVYVKTGEFSVAITRDTELSPVLSPYYILNSITIFGPAFLLVPIAFLFKRTYFDKYNHVFIAWFVTSFLFWSANAENQQARFMIQLMPAAYYLAVLAIENIWRSDIFSNKALKYLKRFTLFK